MWWSPIQTTDEAIRDPQAQASGALITVPLADGMTTTMVASPTDFGATPWSVTEPVPELGQHTELVLLELGRDWEEITALKDAGAIP